MLELGNVGMSRRRGVLKGWGILRIPKQGRGRADGSLPWLRLTLRRGIFWARARAAPKLRNGINVWPCVGSPIVLVEGGGRYHTHIQLLPKFVAVKHVSRTYSCLQRRRMLSLLSARHVGGRSSGDHALLLYAHSGTLTCLRTCAA